MIMKHTFVFLTAILLVVACKKKKQELPDVPDNPGNAFVMPSTVGSYWIYHWDEIDSNGVITPQSYIDTIRIIGDTLINNNLFAVYEGTMFGNNKMQWYERDSSGFVMDPNGKVVCAYNSAPTVFREDSVNGAYQRRGVDTPGDISVPVGTFQNAVRMYDAFGRYDGQPFTNCGLTEIKLHQYYVSGIGLISRETNWFGLLFYCQIRRSRLVEYYIAP